MALYSLVLLCALAVASPWWLGRMLSAGRYRQGLGQRLGALAHPLDAVRRRRAHAPGLVWLHAVSVGEVLAVERLLTDLRAALPGWLFAVSTTTATGQAVARERLGVPVFFFPLDFAFAVRRYLNALRPTLFVTAESELWPRMLVECARRSIPVAVVNARISDRSFPRYWRLRRLWRPLLRRVTLFLAQGEQTAGRLRALGVAAERIAVTGNLKFDFAPLPPNRLVDTLREQVQGRPVLVAGSTVDAKPQPEEALVLAAVRALWQTHPDVLLILAPRHPERFALAASLASAAGGGVTLASDLLRGTPLPPSPCHTLVLDTLGDLAAVYELADVAFLGGSLVARGGHNPLEAARFGVPVTMGASYGNFREIVDGMRAAEAIRILPQEPAAVASIWIELFDTHRNDGRGMGERGRLFAESEAGATARSVAALLDLLATHQKAEA